MVQLDSICVTMVSFRDPRPAHLRIASNYRVDKFLRPSLHNIGCTLDPIPFLKNVLIWRHFGNSKKCLTGEHCQDSLHFRDINLLKIEVFEICACT